MIIRNYREEDLDEVIRLFYNTVHEINKKDYTKPQLDAWAGKDIDRNKWSETLKEHTTYIAIADGIIVGFADYADNGYLDRLYVHKDYQNQGIATKLMNKIEGEINSETIYTEASITARQFFEHRGYIVKRVQEVERKGVLLTNFLMEKTLKGTK